LKERINLMHFAFHIFLEHKRMWQWSARPASADPYCIVA